MDSTKRTRQRKLTYAQRDSIREEYASGATMTALAHAYGVAIYTIQRHTKGLSRPRRIYPANEHVFDVIDDEYKAYFLGLIAADGNVTDKNVISLQLQPCDGYLVHELARWIQPTRPLPEMKTYTHRTSGQVQSLCRYIVGSRHMADILAGYGITPRKSLTLHGRPAMSDELLHHFYRGYFDGDGSVELRQWRGTRVVCVSLVGSLPFLAEFQRWIMEQAGVGQTKLTLHRNIWHLRYSGRKQCARILQVLYEGAKICMARKQERAMQIIDFAKDSSSRTEH